eukprot:gene9202-9369_t
MAVMIAVLLLATSTQAQQHKKALMLAPNAVVDQCMARIDSRAREAMKALHEQIAKSAIACEAAADTTRLTNYPSDPAPGNPGYPQDPAPGNPGYPAPAPAPGNPGYPTPAPGNPGYPTPAPSNPGYPTPAPSNPGYPTPAPSNPGYPTPAPGNPGYPQNPPYNPGYPQQPLPPQDPKTDLCVSFCISEALVCGNGCTLRACVVGCKEDNNFMCSPPGSGYDFGGGAPQPMPPSVYP